MKTILILVLTLFLCSPLFAQELPKPKTHTCILNNTVQLFWDNENNRYVLQALSCETGKPLHWIIESGSQATNNTPTKGKEYSI